MSLVEKALAKMKQAERAAPTLVESVTSSHTDAPVPAVERPTAEVTLHAARRPPVPEHQLLRIDPAALRERGYLPPVPQERELIEQYRQIKRPLVARALGRGGVERVRRGAVIMVTSALPREGKTFTALNLTRSIALEKDATVLLIDCDVANPQATRVLGAEAHPGLIDALTDHACNVESLVLGTNMAGLEVLPIGRATDMGAELLGSHRMDECIERLLTAEPNRIILLDSPPLLITNEGKTLIPLAGQVALVVQADETPQEAVLEAAALFDPGQFVGIVLNQCDEAVGLGYGYYGYGYGSAQGQRRHTRPKDESA